MFIIQKTTKAGTVNTGIECETLGDAKAVCESNVEGKVKTTDDGDHYFRMEVSELLPNGDLNQVYVTDFFEE